MKNDDRKLSRRGFLKGTAAASLGTVAAGTLATGTLQAETDTPIPPHGAELRGLRLPAKNRKAEGRFGFMFKDQPEFDVDDALLTMLGIAMEELPKKGEPLRDPRTNTEVTTSDGLPIIVGNNENDQYNENPNPELTSGFTFIGQFVDHDITFDKTPLAEAQADPDATKNFRTPRYDLDSIYGHGPKRDPQLYDPQDRDKFLVERREYTTITDHLNNVFATTQDWIYDVPRDATGKAIIADPRNDQHLIIIQLHVAFMLFHNKLVDYVRTTRLPASKVFEAARQLTRWHYQWMVIHEFLPKIVGHETVDAVYQEVPGRAVRIKLDWYKPTNSKRRAFIPVEFSVAAYRFGHSITRPRYTVRDFLNVGTEPQLLQTVSGVPLFEDTPTLNNLNGSRPIPPRLKLQWSKLFNDPTAATRTARPVRQFDTRLSGPLFTLPATSLPDSNPMQLLAVRNLLRGKQLRLPSGQALARAMGVTPLTHEQLWAHQVVKVQVPIVANTVVETERYIVDDPKLKEIFADPRWNGEAPLWFYILKEAELLSEGKTLGPVGGKIVAEVLVGLLKADQNSYVNANRGWEPDALVSGTPGKCGIVDILRFAGVWT